MGTRTDMHDDGGKTINFDDHCQYDVSDVYIGAVPARQLTDLVACQACDITFEPFLHNANILGIYGYHENERRTGIQPE